MRFFISIFSSLFIVFLPCKLLVLSAAVILAYEHKHILNKHNKNLGGVQSAPSPVTHDITFFFQCCFSPALLLLMLKPLSVVVRFLLKVNLIREDRCVLLLLLLPWFCWCEIPNHLLFLVIPSCCCRRQKWVTRPFKLLCLQSLRTRTLFSAPPLPPPPPPAHTHTHTFNRGRADSCSIKTQTQFPGRPLTVSSSMQNCRQRA